MGFGKTVTDLGLGIFDNLKVPNGEIANRIAKYSLKGMSNEAGKITEESVKAAATRIAEKSKGKISVEQAEAKLKNVRDTAEDLTKHYGDGKAERTDKWLNDLETKQKAYMASINAKYNKETGKQVMGVAMQGLQAAKAYATEPGKAGSRWGTYATAMIGGRLISGGTPFHNNTGERDIAGIPFI